MTAVALLAGLLLDAAFGEPKWLWTRLPHPAIVMGRAVGLLDARLNQGTQKRRRGVLAVAVLIGGALLTGWVIQAMGPVAEALAAAVLLAQKSLVQHVSAVAQGLRLSVRDGQIAVSMIVSRETRTMTEPQVARAAIESAAENLSDGVIAPAFWFLVAGAPGLLLYKAINTADSMIGYRTKKYEEFGWAAARLDDLLNLIPARLTALMIAVPQGLQDWRGILTDARQHKSPNAGWPEAAMSRRLGIALAGPRTYDGQLQDFAWVNGAGRTDIGAAEVDNAVTMLWRVWWIGVIVTLAIALI